MSVLHVVLFVLLLVCLIFLSVVRNKASTDLHAKLHPPKKAQEEFLKACELYLEYRETPQEHPEPEAEAKYDAAVWIRTAGFLPMALERLPVQRTKRFEKPTDYKTILRADGEPEYVTYEAIRAVSHEAFLACRKQDEGLSGYIQDPCFWQDGTLKREAWADYCAEMDAAFEQIQARFGQTPDALGANK